MNIVKTQRTKPHMAPTITTKIEWLLWKLDTCIHITAMDHQSSCLTCTTSRICSRLLDQSKFLLITRLFLDQEEDLFSSEPTLLQLTQLQDLEDGSITTGWELWSGITNSFSLTTWDISKWDISLTSSVLNSQYSTMYTLNTNTFNSPTCGLIPLRCNRTLTWDILRSNSSMPELIKNTNSLKRELSSTS